MSERGAAVAKPHKDKSVQGSQARMRLSAWIRCQIWVQILAPNFTSKSLYFLGPP